MASVPGNGLLAQARGLTTDQRNAFIAAFLGWTMDAFDYFLLIFVLSEVASSFGASVTQVAFATTLTLVARPFGALFFGLLADRFGRRLPLMADVLFYTIVEFLTGFSNSLTMLLVLRTLYGIGMGGEWGIGASLALEKIPPEKRGFFSGVLQEGYAFGYLLAALMFYLVTQLLGLSWHWLFFIGALPALLVLFIRARVGESEAWEQTQERMRQTRTSLSEVVFNRTVLRRFIYLVILMGFFNFMSHGTQDIYPTFLEEQHGFSSDMAVLVAVIYNIGAIIGGIVVGSLSERIGRRKAIIASALIGIPITPLFALSSSLGFLAAGAFLMQFVVQGAWGVIPAHLTEMSYDEIRGFFPGVTYQLGNLLAALNLPLQSAIASSTGGNYAIGLLAITVPVLIGVAVVTALGGEARGVRFGKGEAGRVS